MGCVFGFIFQFYHLLPELSLLENVLTPLMIRHSVWKSGSAGPSSRLARDLIGGGLDHRLTHKPRNCPAARCSGRPSPGP